VSGSTPPPPLEVTGPELRLPVFLWAVMVREGDLPADLLPVAVAAGQVEAAAAAADDRAAVEALGALCSVWRRRVAEVVDAPEAVAPTEAEGPAADAALRIAARRLAARFDRAARQRGHPPRPPQGAVVGSAADLWRARRALHLRQRDRVAARVLWPEPTRLPVLRRIRLLLGALRRRPLITLFAAGQSREERVAELLATLELCRRGRARVVQRRPYGKVRLLRGGRA
jgi:hypothetical protein